MEGGPLNWTARYFKPTEFDSPDEPGSGANMNAGFISKLDVARSFCSFPWRISAGYRTAAHNKLIGGAPSSRHLSGEAADIACTDSGSRYAIVAAAIKAGIKGIEVCDRHVHLDNRSKPTMWPDKSK
ncbi:hypothetical protein ACVIHC_002184 [Bradyrhizobium diazoefficiens]